MRRFRNTMNNKGVSLIFVILVLMVMSILSVAIFTLFTSNMVQAKQQQDSIRAHYIAISGVEVTIGALMQSNRSLLTNYFDKAISEYPVDPLTDSIELDNGHADIVVSGFVENDERWVMITSTGVLEGSAVSKVIIMKFRVEYPEVQQWE